MKLREGKSIIQEGNRKSRIYGGPTGFQENFGATLQMMLDEELSISSQFDPDVDFKNPFTEPGEWLSEIGENHNTRRIRMMKDMLESGEITQEQKDAHTNMRPRVGKVTNWNDLAISMNEQYGEDRIPTDAMFEKRRNETLAHRREVRTDIQGRQSTGGFWGSIAGGLVGGGLDPVVVVTMPLSAPLIGVSNTSRAAYAFSVATRTAAMEAGIQGVAIEPFIHDWKEEIGAEYTWKDSMFNMAAAGLLTGTVSGAGAGIGFKKPGDGNWLTRDYNSLYSDFKKLGMKDEEAEALALFQTEMNNAPDPNMEKGQFVEELEVHQEKMINEGPETGDVEPLLDASEAADGGPVTFENTPVREATPEVEALAKKMTKAQMIDELNEAGAELDTNPKKHTVASLKKQLDESRGGPEDIGMGDREADEAANAGKVEEAKTMVDIMFDELPEDATMYLNGQKVPLRQIPDEIDSDIKEVNDIITCILNG